MHKVHARLKNMLHDDLLSEIRQHPAGLHIIGDHRKIKLMQGLWD